MYISRPICTFPFLEGYHKAIMLGEAKWPAVCLSWSLCKAELTETPCHIDTNRTPRPVSWNTSNYYLPSPVLFSSPIPVFQTNQDVSSQWTGGQAGSLTAVYHRYAGRTARNCLSDNEKSKKKPVTVTYAQVLIGLKWAKLGWKVLLKVKEGSSNTRI